MLAHLSNVAPGKSRSRRQSFYPIACYVTFGLVCGMTLSHVLMTGFPFVVESSSGARMTAVSENNHQGTNGSHYLRQQQQQEQQEQDDRQLETTTDTQRRLADQLFQHPGSMTYTNECRSSYLYNSTWGEWRAPWADKDKVKRLIRDLQIADLRLPKTLLLINQTASQNMTVEQLEQQLSALPVKDYIIKPTHTSGAVARVVNGTHYTCFKKCRYPAEDLPFPQAYAVILDNMRYSMAHLHSKPSYEKKQKGKQMQYEYIPRQIIVEELLNMDSLREWHWWVVDGQALFCCCRCGLEGTYYSSRFVQLQMSLGKYPACSVAPRKPKTWDTMHAIVAQLSAHVTGIMRLDLYADDENVYFSEITFTTSSCNQELNPRRADALVYAVAHKNVSLDMATPEFVEGVVNDGVLLLPSAASNKSYAITENE